MAPRSRRPIRYGRDTFRISAAWLVDSFVLIGTAVTAFPPATSDSIDRKSVMAMAGKSSSVTDWSSRSHFRLKRPVDEAVVLMQEAAFA